VSPFVPEKANVAELVVIVAPAAGPESMEVSGGVESTEAEVNRTVPAAVPSDFHSPKPAMPSSPVKKSVFPTMVRSRR